MGHNTHLYPETEGRGILRKEIFGEEFKIPRIVVAGTASGVGKTTVSLGLMAVLKKREHKVQPFKVGPDYIDPGYLNQAAGNISRNLDSWMMPKEVLIELFRKNTEGSDIAIIEGVMGLYDGYNGWDEAGSTAQVAKLLKCPVILVIDSGSFGRSAGALALGYREFDPELNLTGVIFNKVGSREHFKMLKASVENSGMPVLGYYQDNIELLKAYGAEVVFFSPLEDGNLPSEIDGIYLGGGFPELYLQQLALNEKMKKSIFSAIQSQMPVYAECGGLIYLAQEVTDFNGESFEMVGALSVSCQMGKRLTLGYREIKFLKETILASSGKRVKGHEFHYSQLIDYSDDESFSPAYKICNDPKGRTEGFVSKNLLASYIHLHFASLPSLAERFVQSCANWRKDLLIYQ